MKKFVIIDGNAIVHRSFHAVPKTLSAPDGTLTNAVYGFTSILFGILENEKPDYLAVAWDMKGPTFRHAEFAEYKGTRAKTDDSLIAQFPLVYELLDLAKVPCYRKEGLEADDFLGIVANCLPPDVRLVIVTGDQDALQLVGERVEVVSPISGYTKVKRYDRAAVHEKLGVWPEQIPDYKGLRGDSSDNIPGVRGIGEKGAASLLEQFESLEGIYKDIEKVEPERIRELLKANQAIAMLSKKIATILKKDGEFDLRFDECGVAGFDLAALNGFFEKMAFRSLLPKLEKLKKSWAKPVENQGSLF